MKKTLKLLSALTFVMALSVGFSYAQCSKAKASCCKKSATSVSAEAAAPASTATQVAAKTEAGKSCHGASMKSCKGAAAASCHGTKVAKAEAKPQPARTVLVSNTKKEALEAPKAIAVGNKEEK
jgi:hypothetical protein